MTMIYFFSNIEEKVKLLIFFFLIKNGLFYNNENKYFWNLLIFIKLLAYWAKKCILYKLQKKHLFLNIN